MLDDAGLGPPEHLDGGVGPQVTDRIARCGVRVLVDEDEDAVRLVRSAAVEQESLDASAHEQIAILGRDLDGDQVHGRIRDLVDRRVRIGRDRGPVTEVPSIRMIEAGAPEEGESMLARIGTMTISATTAAIPATERDQ